MALSEPFPVFDDSGKGSGKTGGFLPKSFPGFVDLGNDLGKEMTTAFFTRKPDSVSRLYYVEGACK